MVKIIVVLECVRIIFNVTTVSSDCHISAFLQLFTGLQYNEQVTSSRICSNDVQHVPKEIR